MTAIVGAALGVRPLPEATHAPRTTGTFLLTPDRNTAGTVRTPEPSLTRGVSGVPSQNHLNKVVVDPQQTLVDASGRLTSLFDQNTKAIIWGQQTKAIQGIVSFEWPKQTAFQGCSTLISSAVVNNPLLSLPLIPSLAITNKSSTSARRKS